MSNLVDLGLSLSTIVAVFMIFFIVEWRKRKKKKKGSESYTDEEHCVSCGVKMLTIDAKEVRTKKVRIKSEWDGLYSKYYCKAHAPKYDIIIGGDWREYDIDGGDGRVRYYRNEVEVDINGEPIGYVKLKEKAKQKIPKEI